MNIKTGLNMLQGLEQNIRQSSPVKAASDTIRLKSQPLKDTFTKTAAPAFDEIYKAVKLNNGRISFVPKVAQVDGKKILPFEMPEFLYHITSETSMELIKASNKLKTSTKEQLPGVFLLDKDNFLKNYSSVGDKKRDLCKAIFKQARDNDTRSPNLVAIKIPSKSLLKNGKLRIRAQEDFFFYKDKIEELQQGLTKKISLRDLCDDNKRVQFEKYVLDNNLMTKPELDEFMDGMKKRIHYGYSIFQLPKLEENYAIEYIYNKDITPDVIQGIRHKKFSINDYFDSKTGKIDIEKLRKFFG